MTAVFVDTSYLIAMADPDDQWRSAAQVAIARLGEVEQVTTDEVLVEFLTALSSNPYLRGIASATVRRIIANPRITVIQQSHDSFMRGLARYEQRPDKGYSLQDCVSMNVMEMLNITEILTADRHFEQEGFIALMRP